MAVKNIAFHFLSATLAVLVVLSSWTSYCVGLALLPLRNRSILAKNLSKKWAKVTLAGKR